MIFLKTLVFAALLSSNPDGIIKLRYGLKSIGHRTDDRFFCSLIIERGILCDGIM